MAWWPRLSSSNSDGPDELLEVGRIAKSHGLRGEVLVNLVTNMASARTVPGARLAAGDLTLTVKAARPHKNRWLVQFDGYTDRNAADGLVGLTLYAPPLDGDEPSDDLGPFATEVVGFAHELIGLRLVDQHGTDHGEVVALVENPAADLVELADGRLVPLAFHQSHGDGVLQVDVPPGLLDGDAH
jgi:16S rRNA processing protein RimM